MVKIGDHVSGFVQGGHWEGHGAFAEYLKTDWDLVWVVPSNTLSHEEAATMNIGCVSLCNPFCSALLLMLFLEYQIMDSYSGICPKEIDD